MVGSRLVVVKDVSLCVGRVSSDGVSCSMFWVWGFERVLDGQWWLGSCGYVIGACIHDFHFQIRKLILIGNRVTLPQLGPLCRPVWLDPYELWNRVREACIFSQTHFWSFSLKTLASFALCFCKEGDLLFFYVLINAFEPFQREVSRDTGLPVLPTNLICISFMSSYNWLIKMLTKRWPELGSISE